MAVPHVSTNFGDLLDPRFQEIFDDEFKQLQSKREEFYGTVPSNGRDTIRWSEVGTLPDWTEFSGSVGYQSQNQGYDVVATYREWASGIQVERKLFDDDQFNVMDQRPRALAASAARTREKHAASILNGAFSSSTDWYNHSESVALCSNSHTTTSGASTANGFDNLITAALTATAVATARIQMVGFRGDQAERISVIPDEIWHPPNLYEQAYEITASAGKVDTADNNRNVHEGKYRTHEWEYLTDTNNWWLVDSRTKKQFTHWVDRIPMEFAMIEDFDTFTAKWRGYCRYTYAWTNWRFILGSNVS